MFDVDLRTKEGYRTYQRLYAKAVRDELEAFRKQAEQVKKATKK